MPSAEYFADKARQCRELILRTSDSGVAEQLRIWADEFDLMASAFSVRPIGRSHAKRALADDGAAGDFDGTGVDQGSDILKRP